MAQFICETFLITLIAVIIAVGLSWVALPQINNLLNIHLSTAFLSDNIVVAFLLCTTVVVTLLSGFYPALVLSGFNPINAIKNKVVAIGNNGLSLRRGLVVLQFCIAQVLVIGMLVMVTQLNYFKNYQLGFDKEAVITVPLPTDSIAHTRINALRDQLKELPGVKAVSFSYSSPSADGNWTTDFNFNNSPRKTNFEANLKWADADYFKLYNLKFIAGKAYTATDKTKGYVVNETLVKNLGITNPQDALGKTISLWGGKDSNLPIVGVVKDFNTASLKKQIPAVILGAGNDLFQIANIKLKSANLHQSLAAIEKTWTATYPNSVYEYHFLDDTIAKFYQRDSQLSALYQLFAGIAIFISCLGLYGLVSFMAAQRTKEVGIRKTLGASVSHIIYLFSKEFTLLVLVAFAISAPLGWYLMHNWLHAFAYQIPLGPGIFAIAIGTSIAIAWLTVGYKSVRAALANPVESLRSE